MSALIRIVGLACGVALLSTVAWAQTPSAPLRVETRVALKQVVSRVEPSWSQDAMDAHPGATLAADVTIGPGGNVVSVNVIVGPDALRPAFVAALQQWTFTPFVSRGRPVPAVVMIDHVLRNPAEEKETKASEDFRAALEACEVAVERRTPVAVATCEAAVDAAQRLSGVRRSERSLSAGMLGAALLFANRPTEAVTQFDRALAARKSAESDSDADSAPLLALKARAFLALGDAQKADAALSDAAEILRRAIAEVPMLKTVYSQTLDDILRQRAEINAGLGRRGNADALLAAANNLDSPPRGRRMPPVSAVAGMIIAGPLGPLLDADDVAQIRALVPDGKRAWLVIGSAEFDTRWSVDVFLTPDLTTRTYRRGPVIRLDAAIPPASGSKPTRKWTNLGFEQAFFQVLWPGRPSDDIRGTDDLNRPVVVMPSAGDPLADDEVVGIVEFLRQAAAGAVGTDTSNDPRASVQRWPIVSLVRWPDGQVQARLQQATTVDGPSQVVTLRREGTGWAQVKLEKR